MGSNDGDGVLIGAINAIIIYQFNKHIYYIYLHIVNLRLSIEKRVLIKCNKTKWQKNNKIYIEIEYRFRMGLL